ncbi:unnamed protein product [Paramecium octaurelia]|uniref:Uncharacterized protein n=1 Tax=Paramecium octaurelia TaxID=43137 RepID=A0A8S1XYC4_PAROT|nr:unnamed protein product [Paramecium octaurelia]
MQCNYQIIQRIKFVKPAIQALGIDNLLDLIQQGDNSQIQVADKFVIDDISIRFLDNFSSSAFCLTTTSLGQMFFKSTQKLLYSLQPWLLQKMSLKIAKGLYLLRKKCFKSCKDFYYNGLLRIVVSNSYDVSFAIILQLAYFQSNNITDSVNSYFSLIFLSLRQQIPLNFIIQYNFINQETDFHKSHCFHIYYFNFIYKQMGNFKFCQLLQIKLYLFQIILQRIIMSIIKLLLQNPLLFSTQQHLFFLTIHKFFD